MSRGGKLALYGGSAVVVAAFAPVLQFRYLAGALVILVGLILIELVQAAGRRKR